MGRYVEVLWTIFWLAAVVGLTGCRTSPPDAMHKGDVERSESIAGEARAHVSTKEGGDVAMPQDALHVSAAEGSADGPSSAQPMPSAASDEEKIQDTARGVAWSVPKRWPLMGEESEFRVRTWRLPAVSMAGAGECALYRFVGGGDPQENLQRWMGEFRGPDGSVESVEAAQAERTIQGAPAWLVRAEGQYVSQTPGVEDSKQTYDNYALFGAVIVAEGDPVFAKCVGPIEVIGQEANSILSWMDSMKIADE